MLKKISILSIFLFLCIFSYPTSKQLPHLLIKIPTRSRPEQFFQILDIYYKNLSGQVPYTFVVSCDENDSAMNNPKVINKLKTYPNLFYYFGQSNNKIEAYNADIDKHEFDIILVTSDDLEPIVKNYDLIIVENMLKYFPQFDGVLNFPDQITKELNTYPVIGKNYYKYFGYVYYPEYKSFCCDNELSNVSRIIKKEKLIDIQLMFHKHPGFGFAQRDDLYEKNNLAWDKDQATYKYRRKNNFFIDPAFISQIHRKEWTIIFTSHKLNEVYEKLVHVINKLDLKEKIEILRPSRPISIEKLAQEFVQKAKGKYISFILPNAIPKKNYIPCIYEQLKNNPDIIELKNSFSYPRSPNPIQRTIVIQVLFNDGSRLPNTNLANKIIQINSNSVLKQN